MAETTQITEAAPPIAPTSALPLATTDIGAPCFGLAPLAESVEFKDDQAHCPRQSSTFSGEKLRPELLAGETAREFQRGGASWYGLGFHGRLTASGERYDMHRLTAAHRTLPFGTLVRVHSLVNGRKVDVRITDRGPFSHGRVIDVSRAAADELGMLGLGFKEVVLLVPESLQTPVETQLPIAKKIRHVPKRSRPILRR